MNLFLYIVLIIIYEVFLIDIKYDNNLSSFYNLLNEEIINNY